ncbi:MAG: AMMECR1 family protein [Deltaproteobacteria bacterium]|nr:AMMECR1 family protein [Deltaproteobacteria bacterium]
MRTARRRAEVSHQGRRRRARSAFTDGGTASPPELVRALSEDFEIGVDGLILESGGRAAYRLPEDFLSKGWGLDTTRKSERKQRVPPYAILRRELFDLSVESGGGRFSWIDGRLFAFTTRSFIESADGGAPLDTFRGSVVMPPLTEKRLREATRANADYLLGRAHDDGRLDYRYFAATDTYDDRYYLPHHAGYVWRMMEAAKDFSDERYRAAADKAWRYLSAMIETPDGAPDLSIIANAPAAQLGTGALSAIIQLLPVRRRRRRPVRPRGFTLEDAGAGSFLSQRRRRAASSRAAKTSPVFSGCRALFLVRLYEKTGDTVWWKAAEEISEGLAKRWRDAGPEAVGDFCWMAQGWARMARADPDPAGRRRYLDLAYSHADAVIDRQWVPGRPGYAPDFLGAADNSFPPRTTPTSARAEALAETYLAARAAGDAAAQKNTAWRSCARCTSCSKTSSHGTTRGIFPRRKKPSAGFAAGRPRTISASTTTSTRWGRS